MKNTLRQVFHSGKFIVGFGIFMFILLTIIIYPIFITKNPLEMVGQGAFYPPGTYISTQNTIAEGSEYTLNIDAREALLESKLDVTTRATMAQWLEQYGGVDISQIDVTDAEGLIGLWEDNYDPDEKIAGMSVSQTRAYKRLDQQIDGILEDSDVIIAGIDEETGDLTQSNAIGSKDYARVSEIANRRTFILGTDNFGRDVLTEMVAATKTSLGIGLLAGVIATFIGLMLGLLAGYVGGTVDNIILFFTNLFTVIPSFVLLILISYSVGDAQRGTTMIGILIGITAWPWTTRSVRSQVISLRNRDHVNLSKLSGHSMMRIILTDILPYVASYVVMAFILQISSGILSEAQLSMIGLGPATTKVATLGLMMNWATQYSAHLNGSWWAYFPVVLVIALISFSLNLMNTGLDQVFNPQLRD